MEDTTLNGYILVTANPCISDYDDSTMMHCCSSFHPQSSIFESNSNQCNQHFVTKQSFHKTRRPRHLDKIDDVPAVIDASS